MDILSVAELVTLARLLVDVLGSVEKLSELVDGHLHKRIVNLGLDP